MVVRDDLSATPLALAGYMGELTVSGTSISEAMTLHARAPVTFPRRSILGIFEPDDEDELVMDDDPATAEIAGKMHDLLDGEYVGITTIAPVTYDNDEDGAGDVRAWH